MAIITAKYTENKLLDIPIAVTAIKPKREIISVSTNPTSVCKIFSIVAGMARLKIFFDFSLNFIYFTLPF